MALTSSPAHLGRARTQQVGTRTPLLRQVAAAHTRRRSAAENAAATRDLFMDVVVVLSVLMFLALASGIGVLVLQSQVSALR
jgi:hypothetical protein